MRGLDRFQLVPRYEPPQILALYVISMNKHEAQSLVDSELERTKDKYNPIDCIVLKNDTIETSWGWVFFYHRKAYIET